MTRWRLFLDGNHPGAHNMAVDEAMLLSQTRDLALPTLRFYGWEPHCLSLGRLQKQLPDAVGKGSQADIEALEFEVVRRPTGGRAVWHAQEITYCIAVREEFLPPQSRSVMGAYAWLSAGFARGLRDLGLDVELAPGGVRTSGANCFAASAGCDFLAGGKKLIGAAQFRRDDAILQHGSLLLSIDEGWRRAGSGVDGEMAGATSLDSLLESLGRNLGRETVVNALCEGFSAHVGAQWQRGGLSSREAGLAQLLLNRKYLTPEWTFGAQLGADFATLLERELGNEKF